MISDKFFEVESGNLAKDIVQICDIFLHWYSGLSVGKDVVNYEEIVDAYAAFESYAISHSIEIVPVKFGEKKETNISLIVTYFRNFKEEYDKKVTMDLILSMREKYSLKLKLGFGYEFTDGDLRRIQVLINELRDIVTESEDFDAKHQDRILRRLEKLQQELHKRVSDLDKFWGLVGDAGVALGKFGKDAKPFVDRIREISDIVWRTQARAEELPSGTRIPSLGQGPDSDE
ncbi:MAG: hypothetical protein V2B15_08210 [Bacteroidota bacterium]